MTARPRTWLVDGLCLATVVALSLALYVGGLGFYSDDWAFLGILHRSPDQSLPGLVDALYSGDTVVRQRPVQVVYLSTLYKAVGLHPLAYHLVNSAALLAAVLLLYALLRELGQPRALAFAVAALYATLPNFSTTGSGSPRTRRPSPSCSCCWAAGSRFGGCGRWPRERSCFASSRRARASR